MKPFSQNLYFFFLLINIIAFGQKESFVYILKEKSASDTFKSESILFDLDVYSGKSVFRSKAFRDSDSLRIKRGYGNGFETRFDNKQLYVVKDADKKQMYKYIFVPVIYYTFAISIQNPLVWNISAEKKKMGAYLCQKATVSYGGRLWTAWFTPDIAVFDGPYVFSGLPGLITEISDDRDEFHFELSQVKKFEWKELYIPKYSKEITWDEYKRIQQNFYNNPTNTLKDGDVLNQASNGTFEKADLKIFKKKIQQQIKATYHPLEIDQAVQF